MAKRKRARATCMGCGCLLGASHRFCITCGRANPNVAVKAQRPAVVKAAAVMAPVYDLQAAKTALLWAEHRAEPDPERRNVLISMIQGGGAP